MASLPAERDGAVIRIESLQNERVKDVVRLRRRGHRDAAGIVLIEGYREIRRALDFKVPPRTLFYAPDLFQGTNEPALIARCRDAGAQCFECADPVFRKMAYRDRPDGLLLLAPQSRAELGELALPPAPLLLVCEHIEKPGNLGTMLRSADAAGADAVLVCDPCTDIFNPNTVRASVGALFTRPVVQAPTSEAIPWLRARGIRIVAATPRAEALHTEIDLRGGVALVVGAEQVGLTPAWLEAADARARIPMRGDCDSLNVASAATILLFEAVRQRTANLPGVSRAPP